MTNPSKPSFPAPTRDMDTRLRVVETHVASNRAEQKRDAATLRGIATDVAAVAKQQNRFGGGIVVVGMLFVTLIVGVLTVLSKINATQTALDSVLRKMSAHNRVHESIERETASTNRANRDMLYSVEVLQKKAHRHRWQK